MPPHLISKHSVYFIKFHMKIKFKKKSIVTFIATCLTYILQYTSELKKHYINSRVCICYKFI